MPRIVANGRHLFYAESGRGEPLVFLSGLGGDHRAFSVPMRHFGASYRALALDARDVGQSDRAEAPYTTAEMAGDVAGWLDALEIGSVHLVGHSLGGLVRAGVGPPPSREGAEPGAGIDARRVRRLAQGGDRVVGAHAADEPSRRLHPGDAPLAGRAAILSQHVAGRGARPCSPSATPGPRTPTRSHARPARPPNMIRGGASDRFACQPWCSSASSTS